MSTFLQVVELLLTDEQAKADYANDPSSFLTGHGLGSFDSTDMADAMGHAADALPMSVAVQLDPEQGLAAPAELDLESQGLSLEREPLLDDAPETLVDDDLDPYGAEADVDFDLPNGPSGDVVDALDAADVPEDLDGADGTEALEVADTLPVADTLSEVPLADPSEIDATPEMDTGDYLTDVPFDLPGQDSPLESQQLEESGTSLSPGGIDDLDVDLPDDLPDDFDLLD